jgi:DNA polymerase-3 subunit alpha
MDFVHLRSHSDYSILEAIPKPQALIKKALDYHQKALALTNIGVMYGAYRFYDLANKIGVKPLIGLETYIKKEGDEGNKYKKIVLIAKNENGYRNLVKIASKGGIINGTFRSVINDFFLTDHHHGLIAISGGRDTIIGDTLLKDKYEIAMHEAVFYNYLFGDDFYLELQRHNLTEDEKIKDGIIRISEALNIKYVATNNIYYLDKDDAESHNLLLMIRDKETIMESLDEVKNLKLKTDEYYFKSTEEMIELFKDNPEAIENTNEIADKCSFEFDTSIKFPAISIPESSKAKTTFEYLQELTYKGLIKRYQKISGEINERANKELEIIGVKGIAEYFLIVADYCNTARRNGIRMSPARGSTAGSIVNYALGITNIDPLKYDLLFERFVNSKKDKFPDIDIDVDETKRDELFDYLKMKYGKSSVNKIVTFGKLSSISTIREIGRIFAINNEIIDKITSKIPLIYGQIPPLKYIIDQPDFVEIYQSKDKSIEILLKHTMKLEGTIGLTETHASGYIIIPDAFHDYIPIQKMAGNFGDEIITQYSHYDLEDLGILKNNILGLRALSIIDETIELIKHKQGFTIDIDSIDLNDKDTYHLFSEGKTFGVFQFESAGMQEILKKLKPNSLEELTAINTIYTFRSDLMEIIPEYIDRKYGRIRIEYLHPIMKESLENTYGIIIYQEQVMLLARDIAGFSLEIANDMRVAMGKLKHITIDEIKMLFIKGAANNEISEELASEIYQFIFKSIKNAINKSYMIANSYLAYQTAWLKANYYDEYMAAYMYYSKDNFELHDYYDILRKNI